VTTQCSAQRKRLLFRVIFICVSRFGLFVEFNVRLCLQSGRALLMEPREGVRFL
jgi:hypothetical protein